MAANKSLNRLLRAEIDRTLLSNDDAEINYLLHSLSISIDEDKQHGIHANTMSGIENLHGINSISRNNMISTIVNRVYRLDKEKNNYESEENYQVSPININNLAFQCQGVLDSSRTPVQTFQISTLLDQVLAKKSLLQINKLSSDEEQSRKGNSPTDKKPNFVDGVCTNCGTTSIGSSSAGFASKQIGRSTNESDKSWQSSSINSVTGTNVGEKRQFGINNTGNGSVNSGPSRDFSNASSNSVPSVQNASTMDSNSLASGSRNSLTSRLSSTSVIEVDGALGQPRSVPKRRRFGVGAEEVEGNGDEDGQHNPVDQAANSFTRMSDFKSARGPPVGSSNNNNGFNNNTNPTSGNSPAWQGYNANSGQNNMNMQNGNNGYGTNMGTAPSAPTVPVRRQGGGLSRPFKVPSRLDAAAPPANGNQPPNGNGYSTNGNSNTHGGGQNGTNFSNNGGNGGHPAPENSNIPFNVPPPGGNKGFASAGGGGGGGFSGNSGPRGMPSILEMYGKDSPNARPLPDHLKGVDLVLADDMCRSLEYSGDPVTFADIAGLSLVKRLLYDSVVLTMSGRHIMGASRLLEAPKAILLFGPPGTGKTVLAKAAANKLNASFFVVSASTIGSKWHGESEKIVKALFAMATEYQPSIIFLDEVDSLLTSRKDNEDASSGKIKTQFLIEMDGANRKGSAQVIVVAATNRPDSLDEAVRRRFERRILLPLPDYESRLQLISLSLDRHQRDGGRVDVPAVARAHAARITEGFSCADLALACKAAAQAAMTEWLKNEAASATASATTHQKDEDGFDRAEVDALVRAQGLHEMSPITVAHLKRAIKSFRPSVSEEDIRRHEEFNELYGWKGIDRSAPSDDDDDDDDWSKLEEPSSTSTE